MGLKILFLSHKFYPDIGGIEVNSEILATAFQRAGHSVRMLTWSNDITNKPFPFEITRNPDIKAVWKSHRWADVVYHNNPCIRLGWPSFVIRKPTVIAIRSVIGRNNGNVNLVDRFKLHYLKRASSVIAVSDALRRKSWPNAKVIPNPYRSELFRDYAFAKQKSGFVFVGRLVSDKGADLAIRAMHDLLTAPQVKHSNNRIGISLTIVGDGPDRGSLENLVRDLGLSDTVMFTGSLQETALVSCLNRHRYIIVPSRREAFGNVALEGMACGCIPIVSSTGGLPEAIGDAGLVFEDGDVSALTARIRMLLKDACLESTLAKAARPHLETHTPAHIARRYLEVIENARTRKI